MYHNDKDYPEDWFKSWFDETYLTVYRHRDDSEARKFVDKWPVWDRLHPGGWALDVGCGSGRYARVLAQRGLKVLAIDLSSALLKNAKDHSERIRHPHYVRADMRNIPASGKFSLVASLFTSFGYFKQDEENFGLLNSWSRLIKTGGYLILDIPNRFQVVNRVAHEPITVRYLPKMKVREERWLDDLDKRIFKRITIWTDSGRLNYLESVRLFDRTEIVEMIETSGFQRIVPTWGDYDGKPFSEESPRMIFYCERR